MDRITDFAALRAIYGPPNERALRKVMPRLDRHARRFIELSPFLLLSTTDANGLGDVAPRGDHPGFVAIEDDETLLLPDFSGNNRLDSLANILKHPGVGMIFLIPGYQIALRVNGLASITADKALIERFSTPENQAKTIIRVSTREVFFHNSKSFQLSGLWDIASQPDRGLMPSADEILRDQTGVD